MRTQESHLGSNVTRGKRFRRSKKKKKISPEVLKTISRLNKKKKNDRGGGGDNNLSWDQSVQRVIPGAAETIGGDGQIVEKVQPGLVVHAPAGGCGGGR